MLKKKKNIIMLAACAAAICVGAFVFIGGGNPQGPAFTEIIQDEPPPPVDIVEVIPPPAPVKNVNVEPVVTPKQVNEEKPVVFDPATVTADVVVRFIPEVTKPIEAEIDPDMEKHEFIVVTATPDPPAPEPPRKPVTEPPKPSEPHGGETNSQGQVWFPGFGWVTPGGENQGETVHSGGDINKQVGEM